MKLGNICNLKCRICSPQYSSKWIAEQKKYDKIDGIAKDYDRLDWPEKSEVFWNNIETLIPVLEHLDFTGGEPFINPEILKMIEYCLKANYEVLILTNAMQPMMRKSVKTKLVQLNSSHPGKLTLRISLDHFNETRHNHERGLGTFQKTLEGMDWLRDVGISMKVAGRTIWDESESDIRLGYENLF